MMSSGSCVLAFGSCSIRNFPRRTLSPRQVMLRLAAAVTIVVAAVCSLLPSSSCAADPVSWLSLATAGGSSQRGDLAAPKTCELCYFALYIIVGTLVFAALLICWPGAKAPPRKEHVD
jgi:hypothetical protein